ncbi:DUF2934 domain-containing protein [Aureimonas sp. Leaf454]|uniref:DUF2934 domain-containing protein n=1 Tax=Aureimonas sp. Leaf454 TaxID=1736381 RepID=UPI0009EC6161|nr:DUF2934 domain-containing protein [Aureimonas sp. Leaf454]
MSVTDTTPIVRERAYLLWEKAGRPLGREHEFWAQAAAEIEGHLEGDQERYRDGRIIAR